MTVLSVAQLPPTKCLCAQEVSVMSSARSMESSHVADQEWVEVLTEVEQAWHAYDERVRSTDMRHPSVGRLWLRLWLAEQRRDELIRARR